MPIPPHFTAELVLEKHVRNGVCMCKVQGYNHEGSLTIWLSEAEVKVAIFQNGQRLSQLLSSLKGAPLSKVPNTRYTVSPRSEGNQIMSITVEICDNASG